MKTITGHCVSVKDVSISKAAKILNKFVTADNGVSHVINAYLCRASASFNELNQFHKDLDSSHSRKKHKRHKEETGSGNADQELDGENVGKSEMHKNKKKKKQELESETAHDRDTAVKFEEREADGKLPNGTQNGIEKSGRSQALYAQEVKLEQNKNRKSDDAEGRSEDPDLSKKKRKKKHMEDIST